MEYTPNYLSKKLNNSSVVQKVIDTLTTAMINKEIKPGDKIPTEVELSKSLGVGRLSIREAVKVLVYYGVLEIRRPEGTFVRQGFSNDLINPMIYGIILNQGNSYDSLSELRFLMEVGVTKLAAKKCTKEDKKLLKEKYTVLKNAVDNYKDKAEFDCIFAADNDFHQLISEIGRSHLVDKINTLVRVLTYDLRFKTAYGMITNGETFVFLDAHEKVCNAICNNELNHIDEVVEYSYFLEYMHYI